MQFFLGCSVMLFILAAKTDGSVRTGLQGFGFYTE